jgi:hypothetical protein
MSVTSFGLRFQWALPDGACAPERDDFDFESSSRFRLSFEHDLSENRYPSRIKSRQVPDQVRAGFFGIML